MPGCATIARVRNTCYLIAVKAPLNAESLSLGEYVRRLRRAANRPLGSVAEETGISYTHLSRIENDSKVPSADSLVKIAAALGGNLELMLAKTNRLPQEGRSQPENGGRQQLRRRAYKTTPTEPDTGEAGHAKTVQEDDVVKLAEVMDLVAGLNDQQLRLIREIILAMTGPSR